MLHGRESSMHVEDSAEIHDFQRRIFHLHMSLIGVLEERGD